MINQKKKIQVNNRIIIPLGDPAGIGTEITLKALSSSKLPKNMQPLLVGCKKNIEETYLSLKEKGINYIANPKDLEIENIPLNQKILAGQPNANSGAISFKWLTHATKLILEGKGRALATAPIAKQAWHKAGHKYSGQTERLAEITKCENPSMLFTAISPKTNWRLNTLLATTHIPLCQVHQELTPEKMISKLNALVKFCKKFKPYPKIAVAGLNPHAGEEGTLGIEETQWINATINTWKKNNPEVEVIGPIPPDTCWISNSLAWNNFEERNAPDGILALYHDQGLIPVKLIAFDSAVNTTLGLPFIRTSPDHGTAFDIAGKGIARPASMLAAINTAWELSQEN